MKPTMEGKAQHSEIKIEKSPEMVTPNRPVSRLLIFAAVCIVTVAVVAGIILGTAYLVSTMKQEAYKEAWVTLINKDNPGETIRERVTLSDSVKDVTRHGVYMFIIERHRNKIVILGDEPASADYLEPCLIADLDTSLVTIDPLVSDQFNLTISFDKYRRQYQSTEEEVDISTLSPRAQDMCFGRKVVKAVDITGTSNTDGKADADRVKRRTVFLVLIK